MEINTVSFTEELSGGSALFRKGERISSFQTSFSRLSSLKDPDPRILGLEYSAVAAKCRICFSTGFIRRRTVRKLIYNKAIADRSFLSLPLIGAILFFLLLGAAKEWTLQYYCNLELLHIFLNNCLGITAYSRIHMQVS